MARPPSFADGSVSGMRVQAAVVRALDAYMTVERKAERLIAELDDLTMPGVVRCEIDPEDSLVIAMQDITENKAS